MARVELRLPQYGMGMADAQIVTWHNKLGDSVTEGDILITADAAKTSVDITAPATGVLVEIAAKEGDVPLVGDLLAVIESAG
jgi:pyruvate/2-oxoglutarate dehydrogenase complex dihydrolipoamide acyltransferase (E2) component